MGVVAVRLCCVVWSLCFEKHIHSFENMDEVVYANCGNSAPCVECNIVKQPSNELMGTVTWRCGCGTFSMWCRECYLLFGYLPECTRERMYRKRRFFAEGKKINFFLFKSNSQEMNEEEKIEEMNKKKEKSKEEKRKERKLHKYLNRAYVDLVGDICIDLAKTYCGGCKIPFSHALFHTCHLPLDEKDKKYGRSALSIAYESGLVYTEFKKILEERNEVKKILM